MTSPLSGIELTRALRRALLHLYDPVELRHSPLPALLELGIFNNPVVELRALLTDAVSAIKPDLNTPANSNAHRYHDLLTYRFIEQMSQKEVASDMALSLRHLQRLEGQALRALAESLAAEHSLSLDWNGADDEPEAPGQVEQEIDWLKKTYPLEKVTLRELLNPATETLSPLFDEQKITIHVDLPDALPPARAHIVPLQQAILHLASLFAEFFPNGTLTLYGESRLPRLELTFSAESPLQTVPALPAELVNGFSLARQVVEACGGALEVDWKLGRLSGAFTLNAQEETQTVLVVDDNQDTLLLLDRYLANSPYTFIGTSQPAQVLNLLEQHRPIIIILDVMLPETDGWSLLAQVKQHPQGHNLPVIISTILPQEKLAHMLGADAFLKKPFTAQQLFVLLKQLEG